MERDEHHVYPCALNIWSKFELLAHRHRHPRASRNGETALPRLTDIANIDFVHGVVQSSSRGIQLGDSVFADHGDEVDGGQVEQLDLDVAEDDDADAE